MSVDKPYSCPTCGAEFATRTELEEHGKSVHPDMVEKKFGTGPKEREDIKP
jgi:hypothetical protein